MELRPSFRPKRKVQWLGFGLIFLGAMASLPRAPQAADGRTCATCCVLEMGIALAESGSFSPEFNAGQVLQQSRVKSSFPGSAWERTVFEALPRPGLEEPAMQWVPRREPGNQN